MAKTCSICSHEYVKRINELIADRKPLRDIAMTYGTTAPTLVRHTKKCLARKVQLAVQKRDILTGVSFLDRIRWNIEQTILLYERNGQVDDKTALAALKEIREACKDEANGPMPTVVNVIADLGFLNKEQAAEAAQMMKSLAQSDEHVSAQRMVEWLGRDYLDRNPEKRMGFLEMMGGKVEGGQVRG